MTKTKYTITLKNGDVYDNIYGVPDEGSDFLLFRSTSVNYTFAISEILVIKAEMIEE